MNIFIDESGSFSTKNAEYGAWNVVAAYVVPETESRKVKKCLRKLKLSVGVAADDEIKLRHVDERNYFDFLNDLIALKGVLLATGTDASLNLGKQVIAHQKQQAQSILNNVDFMKHESGKDAVRYLASQLEKLPIQLYIQLCCQINLMHSFVARGIPYYIQRQPNSLKKFRWKIDQKNRTKTDFEDAFEKFSPAILQAISIDKPTPMLNWCDYRPMKEFMYKEGQMPEYLKEVYEGLGDKGGLDLQKIIRGDMRFVDSKSSVGVQIVDLLVSGLRRCLKHDFRENEEAAKLLGSIMIQAEKNSSPVNLITYGDEGKLDQATANIIRIMIRRCRRLLK